MNVLLEVHYGDREELGPLEPPVGVAVGPVVPVGAHVLPLERRGPRCRL